ncbi:chaperonin CPN60-1, mitochondrial-like [Prunus dulcis]|uniref:chaperonin CPN60-1, mitochondrial-like n=1 Tax=Prunus dulcis TaxID=3755 RepID=UPI0014833A0F|nr:chaperonin CPN60-1, mitochondrial-like [Prunus dulcis]
MVRKIFIYTIEEIKRLSPKIKLTLNEEVKPGKPDSEAAINIEDQSSIDDAIYDKVHMLEELVEFPCMLRWRAAVACNAHAIWRVTTRDREGDAAVAVAEEVKKNNHVDGKTLDNELEVVEGMKLDRGYISPYFITNQNNQKCELENPLIIIHEKKISSINDVVKVLELVLQVSISLVRFTSFFVFTMNWLTNFCSFSEAKL